MQAGAWFAIIWEQLWPLLVPLFLVVCVFATFSWGGGWILLHDWNSPLALWATRIVFAGAVAVSLMPLRQFAFPARDQIVRRIERNSRLQNRPITAQSDRMAMGGDDGFAQALWREHRDRMGQQLDHLTAGAPEPKANGFDPFAMRAMIPLLAFAAFCFSFSPQGGRLVDVYEVRASGQAVPTRIDAWVNPPAYTRKPPIYLTLTQDQTKPKAITAPLGSEFFLRFVGSDEVRLIASGVDNEAEIAPEADAQSTPDTEFRFALEEDTVVRLVRGEEAISQWGISLVPDQPPEIEFAEHPKAALSGSLELSYSVRDDYGVVKARARFESVEPADENARPLIEKPDLNLPLPRLRARKGVSKLNRDLTEHPWAGSRVRITLEAEDDRGQVGTTETREITLPGRRFSKPLAEALIEQRRILAMDANKQDHVANLLDAVSRGPEEFIDNASAVIAMRVAYRRLVDARNDDDLRSTLDLLWEIALGIEFGDLSDAERKLREAQERLSEALENGAGQEEIDKLMKELREAMNEMLQALAEQARNSPQAQNPFEQNDVQRLTQNDLDRMMDRIEDLAKSGSQDAARQLLSELQRMMDNLRAGKHQQQRQAEGNQLNKALDKLSELMQRQQELMNETYRMQRQQEQTLRPHRGQQQGQMGQQPRSDQQQSQGQQEGQQQGNQQGQESEQGQGGQMSAEELADALESLRQQQEALEQQLGELGKQLEELGLGQPQELGEAQEEMGQAGEKLGEGDTPGAATDQGQALEALRQGAQNMMQQMAGDRQQGGQQQSQNGGQGQAGQRRGADPLGRQQDGEGLDANSDVEIPGEIDVQRARRILEAIRKRLSIPENPLIEKDYLERLLDRQ